MYITIKNPIKFLQTSNFLIDLYLPLAFSSRSQLHLSELKKWISISWKTSFLKLCEVAVTSGISILDLTIKLLKIYQSILFFCMFFFGFDQDLTDEPRSVEDEQGELYEVIFIHAWTDCDLISWKYNNFLLYVYIGS